MYVCMYVCMHTRTYILMRLLRAVSPFRQEEKRKREQADEFQRQARNTIEG